MYDLAGVWGLCVLQEHEVHVGGWRGVGDTWRLLCWLLFAPAVPEGPCWAAQVGIVGVKAHLEKAVPVHVRRTDNSYIVSQGLGAHERVNWPTFWLPWKEAYYYTVLQKFYWEHSRQLNVSFWNLGLVFLKVHPLCRVGNTAKLKLQFTSK